MTEVKSAFVVWNPFQVSQFQKMFTAFPCSKLIIINREHNLKCFDFERIKTLPVPFEIITEKSVLSVDRDFDVVFFQSPFPMIEKFRRSHLVSIQYGLAKERHNYGEWRSLADMNLMYGQYSANLASHFAPSYAVGNVKFAGWDHEIEKLNRRQIEEELQLDPSKETVLFMPTYGPLGSFDALLPQMRTLRDKYNIIIKMHHNNEKHNLRWMKAAQGSGLKHLLNGDADQCKLLAVTDVVTSDFSGAIFDAIYAEVPVVLFQPHVEAVVGKQKFSKSSIEYRRRNELGLVCEKACDFNACLETALDQREALIANAAGVRKELFLDGTQVDTPHLIREKVEELMNGKVPLLTTQQRTVRETVQLLRSIQASPRKACVPLLGQIIRQLRFW